MDRTRRGAVVSGPRNLLPLVIAGPRALHNEASANDDVVYLDDDGTQWIKTGPSKRDWRRAGSRPPPDATPDACVDGTAYRQWPHVLVARLLHAGLAESRALDIAETQLRRLRKGDHPRDVMGGWFFSSGVCIPDALAKTLDRMFVETNFTNVDDEWAWKHLFEAAVYDLPPPT